MCEIKYNISKKVIWYENIVLTIMLSFQSLGLSNSITHVEIRHSS